MLVKATLLSLLVLFPFSHRPAGAQGRAGTSKPKPTRTELRWQRSDCIGKAINARKAAYGTCNKTRRQTIRACINTTVSIQGRYRDAQKHGRYECYGQRSSSYKMCAAELETGRKLCDDTMKMDREICTDNFRIAKEDCKSNAVGLEDGEKQKGPRRRRGREGGDASCLWKVKRQSLACHRAARKKRYRCRRKALHAHRPCRKSAYKKLLGCLKEIRKKARNLRRELRRSYRCGPRAWAKARACHREARRRALAAIKACKSQYLKALRSR